MLRRFGKPFFIILFWAVVWEAAARIVGNSIFLVGPVDTVVNLVSLLPQPDFWKTVGFSCGRIFGGYGLAVLLGFLLGALACAVPLVGELLSPVMHLMKSIPVASFVILAILWVGSQRLTFFVVFVIAAPVIYTATVTGLKQTPKDMLEVSQVFRVGLPKRIWYVYRPALWPHLLSAASVSMGLAWKSGVAAEVIGICDHSIGEKLYMSKLFLETKDLFAWTIVIVLLSFLSEKLVMLLLRRLSVPEAEPEKREVEP